MSMDSIDLTQYDTVVSITQNAINEALATYLNNLQKKVALYYTSDAQGNFIPASAETAQYIFTGVLDYAVDKAGNPVDMVVLYNAKNNRTVTYNITFSQAEFKAKPVGVAVTQGSGDAPWVFAFEVGLVQGQATLDQLPPDVRDKVKEATQNLGPGMFSIQQLYLDLNSAVMQTYENVHGLTALGAALMGAILKAYLAEQAAKGGILFGYSVVFSGTGPTPTFMPTGLQFAVTRYTDATGGHSRPGLDTLNYLVMTGGRALPESPPSSFAWNWVDDDTVQGAMAVRHGLFASYVAAQLSPVLRAVCPTVSVKADPALSVYRQPIQLHGGVDHAFQVLGSTSDGVVASYEHTSSGDDSKTLYWKQGTFTEMGLLLVSAGYSSATRITLSGSAITLSGTIATSATVSRTDQGGTTAVKMPKTTYSWSVELLLKMSLDANGELDLVIGKQDFGSAPTVEGHDEGWLSQLLGALGGQFKVYMSDMADLRGHVKNEVEAGVMPALRATLSKMNCFVFPGARTFAFKDPQFSGALDLAAHVTYLAPSASAAPPR